MEKHLFQKINNAKWVIGGFVGASLFLQYGIIKPDLRDVYMFGLDGNGGKMLKIITNLNDEEIAKLKFVRRMSWHFRGRRKLDFDTEPI